VKILVTGATGFVASHLIPALVGAGHDVVGGGHDRARIPDEAIAFEVDLAAPDWPSLPVVDAVVHLAQANVPFPDRADALFAVNVAATQRLLEHARRTGARRFVLASSGSVYGTSPGRLSEESPLAARDFYSATKVAAERLTQAYESHLETAILRLFVPYGPGQVRRMLPRLVERIRTGEPIQLNREGRPRMNPIYVDDVVDVVLRVLDGAGSAGVLNVAGDEVTDIRAVSELIGELVGVEPLFDASDAEVADIVADNRALHAFLGDAQLVPMRDGLARMIAAERG
jgi:UDP-glucose 4-epimerase